MESKAPLPQQQQAPEPAHSRASSKAASSCAPRPSPERGRPVLQYRRHGAGCGCGDEGGAAAAASASSSCALPPASSACCTNAQPCSGNSSSSKRHSRAPSERPRARRALHSPLPAASGAPHPGQQQPQFACPPDPQPQLTQDQVSHVQGLIERCMQRYLSKAQVVELLQHKAGVDPHMTTLVWRKLEEQSPDFFTMYHTRLKLKDQITLFNHLLRQQVLMMQQVQQHASLTTMPASPPPLHPPLAPNAAAGCAIGSRAGPHASPHHVLPPAAGPTPGPAGGQPDATAARQGAAAGAGTGPPASPVMLESVATPPTPVRMPQQASPPFFLAARVSDTQGPHTARIGQHDVAIAAQQHLSFCDRLPIPATPPNQHPSSSERLPVPSVPDDHHPASCQRMGAPAAGLADGDQHSAVGTCNDPYAGVRTPVTLKELKALYAWYNWSGAYASGNSAEPGMQQASSHPQHPQHLQHLQHPQHLQQQQQQPGGQDLVQQVHTLPANGEVVAESQGAASVSAHAACWTRRPRS